MIDIHHHLLPGLDDGPKLFETSIQMAERAKRDGADIVIATPHAYPGLKPFDMPRYLEALLRLNEYCRSNGLTILGGAEIRDSEAAIRLLDEGKIPTMNNTRFILVEWSQRVELEAMQRSIREYSNAGYRVIIAHIERYAKLWRRANAIEMLRQTYDARIQVDCEALLDKNPLMMRLFVRELLKRDIVDYVATDAHDLEERTTRMMTTWAWLNERYGVERAYALTQGNQQELLR